MGNVRRRRTSAGACASVRPSQLLPRRSARCLARSGRPLPGLLRDDLRRGQVVGMRFERVDGGIEEVGGGAKSGDTALSALSDRRELLYRGLKLPVARG